MSVRLLAEEAAHLLAAAATRLAARALAAAHSLGLAHVADLVLDRLDGILAELHGFNLPSAALSRALQFHEQGQSGDPIAFCWRSS